jgi:hypothetical protein
MARVSFENDELVIGMSVLETVLAFHGSFRMPLSHVTGASVSNMRDLHLRWRLLGTGAGTLMTAGIFTTPEGIIFCDLSGARNCLVVETQGERFKRLAFTLDDDQDPEAVAADITKRISTA